MIRAYFLDLVLIELLTLPSSPNMIDFFIRLGVLIVLYESSQGLGNLIVQTLKPEG